MFVRNSHLIGLVLATSMSALAIAGAAAAQPYEADGARSITVSYGDLNLRSEAGAQVMLERIDAAAATVCGQAPDSRLLDRRAYFDRCKADAVARAIQQLNAPMVSASAGQSSTVVVASR
jgi:UrcA family protein